MTPARTLAVLVSAVFVGVTVAILLVSALRSEPEFTDEELRTCQDIVNDGYDATSLEELDAVLDRAETAHCPSR